MLNESSSKQLVAPMMGFETSFKSINSKELAILEEEQNTGHSATDTVSQSKDDTSEVDFIRDMEKEEKKQQ